MASDFLVVVVVVKVREGLEGVAGAVPPSGQNTPEASGDEKKNNQKGQILRFFDGISTKAINKRHEATNCSAS